MHCPYCGTTLPDESRFCKICGRQIGGFAPAAPQYADQPEAAPYGAAPQYADQQAAAPFAPPPRSRPTKALAIIAGILAVGIVGIVVYVLCFHVPASSSADAGAQQETNGTSTSTDPIDALINSYEKILDNPKDVDYLQGDDPSTYELTGVYRYFLIDLQNDGSPDLVMVADCTVHAPKSDIACTLARVMVYDAATGEAGAVGNTIKAGGEITMSVTPDCHGIRTLKVDKKTGKAEGTTYTLEDPESAQKDQGQADNADASKDRSPNLVDVSDRSLLDKLRLGTWTDKDAAK